MKTTVIKKGTHAPWRLPILHLRGDRTMEVVVTITDDMFKATPGYWHKIAGYSRGYHKKNSERICFYRPVKNPELLFIDHYWYRNWQRGWSQKINANVGDVRTFYLRVPEGPEWGYILRPYHGGEGVKAPEDIRICWNYSWV